MTCRHCGSAVSKDTVRCPVCGSRMISARIRIFLTCVSIAAIIIGSIIATSVLSDSTAVQSDSESDLAATPAASAAASPALTFDTADAAYEAVIADYKTALTMSGTEWQSSAETYLQSHPHINPAYVGFFHIGMFDTLYTALYDIDGNGTDELFIGIGDSRSATEIGVYAFDGSRASVLSLSDTPNGYQILTDGTFIQGDKGGTILTVKKIADDGCSLEDAKNSALKPGDTLIDVDLSAHGGNLTLNNWEEIPLE